MKNNNTSFKSAVLITLPIFFAYFPLSMLFGVVFVHAGFDGYLAILMSVFLYAGAAQFLVLTMLTNNALFASILVACFFVAFRNAFYGLAFIERYQKVKPFFRGLLAFGMVDATYALLIARPKASITFCAYVTGLIYSYWVLGTLVGVLFAELIPNMSGAHFILEAFFMTLVIDFYAIHRSITPLVMPLVFSFVAYLFTPSFYLILAIGFSLLFISAQYLVEHRTKEGV